MTDLAHEGARRSESVDTNDEARGADEVMTTEEVAVFLKMHVKTVYKLADSGTIPHVRISERRLRFLRSSLLAWLQGRESTPRKRRA